MGRSSMLFLGSSVKVRHVREDGSGGSFEGL